MAASKFDAIIAINPNATVEGNVVDGEEVITWKNGMSPISDSDIAAKQTELDSANAHVAPRRQAYKSYRDQLDLLYKDLVAGKLDANGEWAKHIKAVKDAHPKN